MIIFFRELLKDHDEFYVPEVIDELSTQQILTTEYVEGLPLDACTDLDQETKNKVSIVLMLSIEISSYINYILLLEI